MDDNNPEISLIIDDQVFKAKRNDLIEHSDFFRAMFTGNYVERERKQIFIEVNIILYHLFTSLYL